MLFFLFSLTKETTLERADFTLQLLMFVTMEKEDSLSVQFFVRCCPHSFKQGQAERFQTMKAQTNRPRSRLFLM